MYEYETKETIGENELNMTLDKLRDIVKWLHVNNIEKGIALTKIRDFLLPSGVPGQIIHLSIDKWSEGYN